MSPQANYKSIINNLYHKHFFEDEAGLNGASEFWQRKGAEAASLIKLKDDSYVITDEFLPLGNNKTIGLCNKIKHLPIDFQLKSLLNKYKIDTQILAIGKKIAKERNIIFGYDHVKQLLCCDVLKKLKLFSHSGIICVIGDGYGYVTTVLKKMFPERTVICVNLGKMLIFDLIGCEKSFGSNNNAHKAYLANETYNIQESNNGAIYFLEAENYNILKGLPINLFINICSMQEMRMDVIKNYFSIMRSSSTESYFYCCNRVEKKLRDGSCINFNEYPWSENDTILFDEICPWLQKRPVSQIPFNKPFQPHQHRAVKL